MKPDLLSIIDQFHKAAGVIQVPEKVLKEAIAWAKSVYCEKLVLPKIAKERGLVRGREGIAKQLQQMAKSDLFRKVKEAEKGRRGEERLFNLLYAGNEINIAHFDADRYDGPNVGVYDWIKEPPALELHMNKQRGEEGEVFDLFLEINYGNMPAIKIQERELSRNAVLDLLEKHLWDMHAVIYGFEEFVSQFEVYDKEYKTDIVFIDAICKQSIKEQFSNPYMLVFSLKDSPYFTQEEAIDKHFEIMLDFIFTDVMRKQIYAKEEWVGLWTGNLFLYISRDEPISIKDHFAMIDEVVRHELQHMMQTYLSESKSFLNDQGKKVLPPAGIPGKKYQMPGYNEYGRPSANAPQPTEMLPHALRDIEFYTNLTDKLDQYKAIVPQVPLPMRGDFFKAFVSQMPLVEFRGRMEKFLKENDRMDYNPFFLGMAITKAQAFFDKLKGYPKYEKSVKVLYAELSKLGLV